MRAAKAVVIILAVLIFVALGAVVWAIFNLQDRSGNRLTENRNVAALAEKLSLGLPAGCAIAAMELDGNRLAVRTAGPPDIAECGHILIVDLARGEVVTRVGP